MHSCIQERLWDYKNWFIAIHECEYNHLFSQVPFWLTVFRKTMEDLLPLHVLMKALCGSYRTQVSQLASYGVNKIVYLLFGQLISVCLFPLVVPVAIWYTTIIRWWMWYTPLGMCNTLWKVLIECTYFFPTSIIFFIWVLDMSMSCCFAILPHCLDCCVHCGNRKIWKE